MTQNVLRTIQLTPNPGTDGRGTDAAAWTINFGHSGAWYDRGRDGQGLSMEIVPETDFASSPAPVMPATQIARRPMTRRTASDPHNPYLIVSFCFDHNFTGC